MPVEVSQPTPASQPVAKNSHLLQSPEAFESLLGHSRTTTRPDGVTIADRRSGTSDLERASWVLVRAIQYLTYEQRSGKVTSIPANRKAIAVLCGCVDQIAHVERREPAKRSLLAWLRNLRVN